ncbi:MAG: hypothetical protein JXE07_09210 [Candidatus Aminicenantes bacterium]|nr:hypothetical protein [Candidatus Aminicenantes bacterium]
MKTSSFRLLTFGTLLLFSFSCATRVTHLAPEEIGKTDPSEALTVTLNDGSEVPLKKARLDKYKLIGVTPKGSRQEIELSSIKAVLKKRDDYSLAIIGAGVAGIAAWLIIGINTAPSPPPTQSCPFVYSFDGECFIFDAEPYGGAICQALQRTEWCGLEHLKETGGLYRILVTNELDESQYTDELKLVVVDHPPGIKVAPDAAGRIHTFIHPVSPLKALQNGREDISEFIVKQDSSVWASRYDGNPSPDVSSLKDDLVFEFAKPRNAQKAKLLLNASTDFWGSRVAREFLTLFGNRVSDWYDAVNAGGVEFRKLTAWHMREELYLLQVRVDTPDGWKPRGIIYGGGPFVAEDKAVILDIGDVTGETLRIKLTPPKQFWNIDLLAIDYSHDMAVDVREIAPASSGKQADPAVDELLAALDDRYFVMPRTGDSVEIVFPAPPEKPGSVRSLLLKASGYYDVHLSADGEPRVDLVETLLTVPGSTLDYALKAYRAEKKNEVERSHR